MEHSRTALPTCYRILYYYGDFPVALGFAQTVRESGERERAGRGREQREQRSYFESPHLSEGKRLSTKQRDIPTETQWPRQSACKSIIIVAA